MKPSMYGAIATCVGFVLVMGATTGAAAQESPFACAVSISSPQPGEMVGRQRIVAGKAIVPSGSHLWLFVRIRGLSGWWPQGGGEAEMSDGQWEVLTIFGQDRDIGSPFETVALFVNGSVHQELERYVDRAAKANEWAPIRLPNTLQGCPIARVTVTKTSH